MITRPLPLPDELDRGFLGRVIRLNGFRDEKECVAELSAWTGLCDRYERAVPGVMLLSRVAGMDTESFTVRHTTLPFRRGITSYMPTLMHGCESSATILRNSAMRLARPGAYFCRKCAEADQDFHGMSYWRREHQIPGALWCSNHATPLSYVEDERAFLEPPAASFDECFTVDHALAEATAENLAVRRYLEICADLLERPAPLDVKDVARVLAGQARLRGLQTWPGKTAAPLLSDKVADEFDAQWLAIVLPDLAAKAKGQILSRLDGVLYLSKSASSTVAYVLAASVLYDSPDEALKELQSAAPHVPSSVGLQASRRPHDDDLHAAYVATGGGHAAVAKLLGANYGAVSPRLDAMGLPKLLSFGKGGVRVALRAFLLEGRSVRESAEIGEVSVPELESSIRTACKHFVETLELIESQTKPATRPFVKTRQAAPHEVSGVAADRPCGRGVRLGKRPRKAEAPRADGVVA
ncbi:MAG: TniQ family protein [Nitrospira sp.]|nr:TniQ family protein [Nitrospira sp.]